MIGSDTQLRWAIITGEYPPKLGGVSDYTRQVACGLAQAGDEVHVWAPPGPEPLTADAGVHPHRLAGNFDPRSLASLGRALDNLGRHRLLVQYVPHAFGWKAMNLPLCLWLFSRRRKAPIWVTFHEVAFGISRQQPLRHNLLGAVNNLMAFLVARSAQRIFIASGAWETALRPLLPARQSVAWLPVPSGIPVVSDPKGVDEIRTRYRTDGGILLGHFGTYGKLVSEPLAALVPVIGQRWPTKLTQLMIGENADAFRSAMVREHPHLAGRLFAAHSLKAEDVSRHVAACDLMVQPYPDGVSTRRTSTTVALSHGRPVVTTVGDSTEPLWAESGAVALAPAGNAPALLQVLERLLADERELERLSIAAERLYLERFDLRHTIAALHATQAGSGTGAGVEPDQQREFALARDPRR